MDKKTFEDWLRDRFEPDGVLDDDMPDAFNGFIADMDSDEMMEYADLYGQACYLQGGIDVLIERQLNIK